MDDIRRKCNPIVDSLKFTSNKKNIEWSCNLNLQPSSLSNFIRSVIMLGLKEFRVVTILCFKDFLYNNNNFFQVMVVL